MPLAIIPMVIVYLLQVQANLQQSIVSYQLASPAVVIDVFLVLISGYAAVVLMLAGCRDTYKSR